jgi:hypothetical protein
MILHALAKRLLSSFIPSALSLVRMKQFENLWVNAHEIDIEEL